MYILKQMYTPNIVVPAAAEDDARNRYVPRPRGYYRVIIIRVERTHDGHIIKFDLDRRECDCTRTDRMYYV